MVTRCFTWLANATVRIVRPIMVVVICCLTVNCSTPSEVIWAVNCGGDSHTDQSGIVYQKDPLQRIGVASDYGRSLVIQRVPPHDQILYQTERYHTANFAYEVPITRDGDYIAVLKFCEVWFTQPNQKIFDVTFNGQITVIDGLDIFAKVGRGVAHDEIIPFSVRGGVLRVGSETALFNGKLAIEFVKLEKDNPKINAIFVMRGTADDVPRLPVLPGVIDTISQREHEDDDEDLDDDDTKLRKPRQHHTPSEPKVQDPYASDDTGSMLLPVFVAVGAFIPLLICLCQL